MRSTGSLTWVGRVAIFGCGMGSGTVLMAFAATSLAVLVAGQKNGGLSLHLIWRESGMTSSGLSPGLIGGSTYAKLKASAAFTTMRQYPSLRLTLEKRNGMPVLGARASAQFVHGVLWCEGFVRGVVH